MELKLQTFNGWEQEDFNEKWDEQPEEKSPTKVYSPPLAPGISVRKVHFKNPFIFSKISFQDNYSPDKTAPYTPRPGLNPMLEAKISSYRQEFFPEEDDFGPAIEQVNQSFHDGSMISADDPPVPQKQLRFADI